MRVKVEGDDGTLHALLVVEPEDPNGIVGWRLFIQGDERTGNIWAQGTDLRDAAHCLETATKAHRGARVSRG